MVDAADHEKMDAAKAELSQLLEKPQLAGIPVSGGAKGAVRRFSAVSVNELAVS